MRTYLEKVEVKTKNIDEALMHTPGMRAQIAASARLLRDKRIVHINATSNGGGVAELLHSQVAYEQNMGLRSQWWTTHVPADFFVITKKIHNLLQGGTTQLTPEDTAFYTKISTELSQSLADLITKEQPDLIIAHDPQPALAVARTSPRPPSALRIHVDISQPNAEILQWLCGLAPQFQHVIVSQENHALTCVPQENLSIILPAIDPTTIKNTPMLQAEAQRILADHGIDPLRPIITQVSRFDAWKYPLGVLAAYRTAKESIPNLQVCLVGFFQAEDDAEAQKVFMHVQAEAQGDTDIHLFSDLQQLQNISVDTFVNAIQTASDIILQLSTREGFGLTVTEAMWKEKAIVTTGAGGISYQITDKYNGLMIHSPTEAGEAIVRLLQDDTLRSNLGKQAHQTAIEKFLFPRYLQEHLELYAKLLP